MPKRMVKALNWISTMSPANEQTAAKASAALGVICPEGMGRLAVRETWAS